MTLLYACAITAAACVGFALLLHFVSRIGMPSGPSPRATRKNGTHWTGAMKRQCAASRTMRASVVGQSAVTGAAVESVNPCGAGVRVLPADDWGFRWLA